MRQKEYEAMIADAKSAFDLGETQAEIRVKFGDGMGQKLWSFLVLNKRFPNLGLTNLTSVQFGKVKMTELLGFCLRSDPIKLTEENTKRLRRGQEPFQPATAKHVENYLDMCFAPPANMPKIMSKDTIATVAEHHSCVVVRDVAKAILLNDTDILKKYDAYAKVFNAVADALFV